ncbi:MAG: protein kinase [Gemmataceae bacterium]
MPEPQSQDETKSALGHTKLISGPNPVPVDALSTNAQGDPSQPTSPANQHPLPTNIGRFEVRACLGGGAFGWVYRAFDPTLRREVAVKLPRADRLQSQLDRSRFLNEARAAATIRHPQVVPVHEVGEVDGTPFIVMGYVAGPTLADVVRQRGQAFPPAEAAKIVRSLALAVQAAHDKGVVHRDLKPGNVLLDTEHGQYVVTDFGLARVVDPNDPRTSTTGIAGTPAYMPPEQARGDTAAIGPRSDVYALGVILFELLTGRLPFTGNSVADVISQVLMVPPPSAMSLNANIPAGLDVVCRKAMAKAPDDRYSSAHELAATLAPFATEPESHMQSTQVFPNLSPAQQSASRGRGRLVGVGLLGFGGAAAIALGLFLNQSREQHANTPPDESRPPTPPPAGFNQAAERRAAEWVLRNGGSVEVLDIPSGTKISPTSPQQLPTEFRLVRLELSAHMAVTDEAVIANLTGLSGLQSLSLLACPELTNAGLAVIAKLPNLQHLSLRFCLKVNDTGVATLERHPTLRDVYIAGSGMTAKGVATLATIPHLEVLSFHGHAINDDWLKAAAGVPALKQLYCGFSQNHPGGEITAAGFGHLKTLTQLYLIDLDSAVIADGALKGLPELPALNQLFLAKIPVSDDDLADLVRKYPNLISLALHESKVTDAGMATVANLKFLERVYLDGTSVTDKGLRLLATCEKLRLVSALGTRITPEGVERLQAVLPESKVSLQK